MTEESREDVASEVASVLRILSTDLQGAGDVALVWLSEDGVGPASITLADELWLLALRLDGRLSNEDSP